MMKVYSELVNRQLKVNKRRTLYTIISIILGISLFTSVMYLKRFMSEINIEAAKQNFGNYEMIINQLTPSDMNRLKGNILIEDVGFSGMEIDTYLTINNFGNRFSIYAVDAQFFDQAYRSKITLVDGEFPTTKGQIALDVDVASVLDAKLFESIVIEGKSYVVCGLYKWNEAQYSRLSGLTIFLEDEAYLNTYGAIVPKGKSNKIEKLMQITRDIGIENFNYNNGNKITLNSPLLNEYGEVSGTGYGVDETKLTLNLISGVIIIVTISLIYGAIHTSMSERMDYLTLLRVLGATSDKIRYLLIKESFLLASISILPGILLGNLTAFLILDIMFKYVLNINLYQLSFQIYWDVILFSIFLTIITILISSIIPFIGQNRKSRMDIGKGKNFKVQQNKMINKLFGFKGKLAYRNLRANFTKFMVTTFSLSLLLIIFVTFTGFFILREQANNRMRDRDFYINLTQEIKANDPDNQMNILEKSDGILSKINELNMASQISQYIQIQLTPIFSGVQATPFMQEDVTSFYLDKPYVYTNDSQVFIYDEASFNEIKAAIKGTDISLAKFKDNGIILVNTNTNNLNFERVGVKTLDVTDGMPLSIYFTNALRELGGSKSELEQIITQIKPTTFTVLGTLDTANLLNGARYDYSKGINFIISEEFYKKHHDLLFQSYDHSSRYASVNINFNFLEDEQLSSKLEELNLYLKEIGAWSDNEFNQRSIEERELKATAVLIYTILLITISIEIFNMINLKYLNMSLRKKEIAMLLAVGGKKEDLRKIILLEGIIQWMIASIIGGVLSYLILKLIYVHSTFIGEIQRHRTPVWIILIGIIGLFIINYMTSLLPLKRFKSLDTVDMIRNEE